jgi:hypothetical protein
LLLLAVLGLLANPALGQLPPRWPEERTAGPFLCHADFSLAEYGPLLDDVCQLQEELAQALAISAPREAVHLFLFERKTTYEQYVRYYYPEVPRRRALFIKARGPGMVYAFVSKDVEVDVRHECTHALLHAALPMVPLWLDEGLAEYYEVPRDERAAGNPHLRSIQWRAQLGLVPRIEELEQLGELQQMTQTHYQRSWAWVHFMLHGPQPARDELQRFLSDIAAHTPPGHLSERLRRRIPDLERTFRDHFRNWR